MIVNMFIHLYFTLNDVPYKKLLSTFYTRSSAYQQCPNCHAKLISGTAETTTKKGYSLIRGEDYLDVEADPIPYRDSEDSLGEGAEGVKQAKQPEVGGKSKVTREV